MTLYILYEDGTDLSLQSVEGVRIMGPNKIVTKTYGNSLTIHNKVHHFTADFTFPIPKTVEEPCNSTQSTKH